MTLTAHWALMSKEMSDSRDYRVLQCSEGLATATELEQAIRELSVGNLGTAHDDRPEAPPWITMGPRMFGGQAWVGLVIREHSALFDYSGRPVTETRYFCLPREVVEREGLTCRAFYDAVKRIETLPKDGETLNLEVDAPDPAAIRRRIEDGDFDFFAGVAALLLESRVALLNPGVVSVEEKLDRINGVLAFLPAGLRHGAVVSSWMSPGSAQRVQLGFTSGARSDQQGVPWGEPPRLPEDAESVAREYRRRLRRICAALGTDALLRSLSSDLTPRSFEDPRGVLASLDAAWRPLAVLDAARSRTVSVAEIVDLIRSGSVAGMSVANREALLEIVLQQGDIRDLDVIREYRLVPPVSALVVELQAEIEHDGPGQRRIALIEIARSADLYTRVLAELVACSWKTREAVVRFVGLLVSEAVVIQTAVRGGDEQLLRMALLEHPIVLYELLGHTGSSGLHDARDWLRWLDRSGASRPPILHPWLVAVGSDKSIQLASRDIDEIARIGERYVGYLIGLSGPGHAYAHVLAPACRYLAGALAVASRSGEETISREDWGNVLEGATSYALDLRDGPRAWTDMLLLLATGAPYRDYGARDLLAPSNPASSYLEALAQALSSTFVDERAFRSILDALRAWAGTVGWGQRNLADNVVELVEQIRRAGASLDTLRLQALRDVMADAVTAGSLLDDGKLSEDTLDWLAESPAHEPIALRARLRRELRKPSPSPQGAAQIASRLLARTGLPDGAGVVSDLRAVQVHRHVDWVEEFLFELDKCLQGRVQLHPADREETLMAIQRALMHAAPGSAYRTFAVRTIPHRLRRLVLLLHDLRDELSDEDLALLVELGQDLRGMSRSQGLSGRFQGLFRPSRGRATDPE